MTETLSFTDIEKGRIEEIKSLYPDKRSAAMPLLFVAQEKLGHITDSAIEWVSEEVGLSPVHVRELVTFYTMYYQKPVGKYHIQVCRTLSCALLGSKEITEYVHNRLGILSNEVSEDGNWSFEQVECLGSCGTAPMCEINDVYFENLTPEKIGEIMDAIEKEKPDLRYSTLKDKIGEGLANYPKSSNL